MEVLEKFLKKDFKGRKNIPILDACSGKGRLLYYLNEFDPTQQYFGFDYVKEFVDYSNELFKDSPNIHCEYGDIFKLPSRMNKKYEITILYKTLAWIPDLERVLKALFRVTNKKIYITTPVYEGDIDFEVKAVVHKNKTKPNYTMHYIYGIPRIEKAAKKLGAKKIRFHDLKLPIDLPKPKDLDVLQTYTLRTAEGDNVELTNIIKLDWKLIEIEL